MKSSTRKVAAIGVCALLAGTAGLRAQTVPNGSFEADAFTVWPGYVSLNGPITGWTGDAADRIGLNPAAGSPFADNGAIPDGANVALIQAASGATPYLQTTLSGLVSGVTYRVSYRYNARNFDLADGRILSTVDTATPTILQNNVCYPVVGGSNPYYLGAYEFTATAGSHVLRFQNTMPTNDTTILLDDVRVQRASDAMGLTIYRWTGDADSGIDSALKFSHALNFGTTAGPTVNGVVFKGYGGGAPSDGAAGANFSTASGMGGVYNGDGNNVTAAGGGSGSLASDFIYGGSAQSVALNGLLPGRRYKTSIFAVGWDDQPSSRRALFSVNGSPAVTLYHPEMGNDNGLRHTWRTLADAGGTISVADTPLDGAASWHYYAVANQADPSNEIVATSFAGLNGGANGQNITHANATPDYANRPGSATWTETGMNGAFHVDVQNGAAVLGPNAGAAISIASSGGYTKPTMLSLQGDVQVGTIVGTDYEYARGVGLGFYVAGGYEDTGLEVRSGFTGLVLSPQGALYRVLNGIADQANMIAYGGGTFDPAQFYTLSYNIDTTSGALWGIALEGSTADYSVLGITAAFDDTHTAMVGVLGSSASGGTSGGVDNFVLAETVPEPGTLGMAGAAVLVLLGLRRRQRRS